VIAAAASISTAAATERLRPAARRGVLDEFGPTGVRFHHSLLSDAAGRQADASGVHARLADAWDTVGGLEARASAVGHRLRGALGAVPVADAIQDACVLAAELVAAGQRERAAGLLRDAHEACADCGDRPELRATVALDLADILSWLGDLHPALTLYQEAAELARGSSDPVTRARAEIGANLGSANK
jgi:tetratricopeptide (TPR) repeat protein